MQKVRQATEKNKEKAMKNEKNASIVGNQKNKALVEKAEQMIFRICASFANLAVISIT